MAFRVAFITATKKPFTNEVKYQIKTKGGNPAPLTKLRRK
jgi:hypothetical protein